MHMYTSFKKKKAFQYFKQFYTLSTKVFYHHQKTNAYEYSLHIYSKIGLTMYRAEAKIYVVYKFVCEVWHNWIAVLINNTRAIPQICTPQLPNIAEGRWADG